MMKHAVWLLALLAGLVAHPTPARACTNQNCAPPSSLGSCYNLTGVRWCQITYGYNPPYGHWTPVNSYNHTRYGAVQDSWARWNAPPNGPTNSLYLYSDGANHSNHDIDYWEVSTTDWWWGYASFPGGVTNGCINRGGAMIQLNVYRISSSYTWQLWLMEHETGHAIGIDHVCGCSEGKVMNPCTECWDPATLSWCDGRGANELYH